jgi:RHH-type transcriptional regulator, proline utilization regulon repressor / proline dehydrogenase / delta 1-pyrroline-5-carboxylate dehydrogenase
MPLKHSEYYHMQKAIDQLEQVKGKKLSLEEREKAAIDLASHMLQEAVRTQTYKEKRRQEQLSRMMKDPLGKAFTTSMTDQCFRSRTSSRVANQLIYLLNLFGIPQYLDFFKRCQLGAFRLLAPFFAPILVPLVTFMLRKETSSVILPGEASALSRHMHLRRQQGVRINLNHLGEAILGEKEAKRRLQVYLSDLEKDDIEYISIKISTIYSQIHLLAWEKSLDVLAERLRQLYRAAMKHSFTRADGTKTVKFVNLDMEEYRDLILTKELFKKVLSEPEFLHFSAGIVLQAYLPDCYKIQQELTEWSIQRMLKGGAPIKIRIVKGANLAMEQFEASLRGWPQAPYKTKAEVDANYKRMVIYGCDPDHAKAVHLGIGSHNLFDIAFAMLLRAENKVESCISFEMLEGMADHIRRVVQRLTGDILLYCPVATKEDFQSAIAYLIRRLDENTGPENFLRYTFGLRPGSLEWEEQVLKFSKACTDMQAVSDKPRRSQSRLDPPVLLAPKEHFENEPDTDFSLPVNRQWAHDILSKWHKKKIEPIPCVIDGKEHHQSTPSGKSFDPSYPQDLFYTYSQAEWTQIDQAIQTAKKEEPSWAKVPVEEKADLLAKVAQKMREKRGDLIGVMMADGGKAILEGDPEVSEAIDFAEYYLRSMLKMHACTDIVWKPKGTVLVTPPWNFPISIPAGGILAALAAGNCVLFKPAPEAVLSGWVLVNLFWEAGISKKVLQFINCEDEPVGSTLIADPRIDAIVLTGATSTARLFQRIRPGLDLAAETGGKNALIITALADRDLAIKDLIQSAFGHSGQKCSAASLAILEAEVYDDPHFREQLRDAVESLKVGSPWDLSSKVTPLIRPAHDALKQALTTLDPGEEWLVKPKQDPHNPNLWSPGVKIGVKENSFMHQTELFGPVLGVMRASNLDHAIKLANGTPYGLTSGISSLDEREQRKWISCIEAGNLYINRGITGAIVRRQPFGGCKASSFGHGSKAGGPNYVSQFAHPTQVYMAQEKQPLSDEVNRLTNFLQKVSLSTEDLGIWYASTANYAFWAKHFHFMYDPEKPEGLSDFIVGQDNAFFYRPHRKMAFRIQENDSALNIFRVLAAALSCHAPIEISWTRGQSLVTFNDQWKHQFPQFRIIEESEEKFIRRVGEKAYDRVRLLSPASDLLIRKASEASCYLDVAPPLANGRFELLHYVREVALSCDYHRYGNLGVREKEHRKEIL